MGTGVEAESRSRSIPTTGMRGGLGRTLLTAFLILTILPLALIGYYVVWQNDLTLKDEAVQRLGAVARLNAQTLRLWWADRASLLLLPAEEETAGGDMQSPPSWEIVQQQLPDLEGATLIGEGSKTVWSVGSCEAESHHLVDISSLSPDAEITLTLPRGERSLKICSRLRAAMGTQTEMYDDEVARDGTLHVYLVQQRELDLPQAESPAVASPALEALTEGQEGGGSYVNHENVPVVGAYYPLPELGLGVLVEQEVEEILVSNDQIAATLIAVILVVVLVTTFISAVMIRQITRPVIRLTESALDMSGGNLKQSVAVTSKDEIGILTYVFNQMAAELASLYEDLEAKVVERTQMLQRANYQIQRRALQLEASLEVSKAVTSIRDPGVLLNRVTKLISDRFLYTSVAIYLLEPGGGRACLQAHSPADAQWPDSVHPGDGTLIERALRKGEPQVEHEEVFPEEVWHRRTLSHVVVPLKMEARVTGAIAVLSAERESVQEDDVEVLVHLANQVAVALENARAYERERLAAKQMEDAEAFKARFLANMSHDLREPLNSIIGFSRLMLKGLDGPLTDQQRDDLHRVYENSQRLLELINDILTISQIQAGLMELEIQPVNLEEIVNSVIPTARALVRGKEVELVRQIPDSLAPVWCDAGRIRQVLVHLLTNAAKFTEEGEIVLKVWTDDEQTYVSVRDTGLGISKEDSERIFARFEKGKNGYRRSAGMGLGLALTKEFVEMHGGRIWFTSEMGQGTTFTFSLPLRRPVDEVECEAVESTIVCDGAGGGT